MEEREQKKEKADVSVILPSLNVAPYIRECIESVLNQTLESIEILCVDAGSTDGTLEILKEYEKQDKRVRIIHSERKSYGYQMNLGVRLARGDYIGIVDTDDMVDAHMYGDLFSIAKENKLDLVKADHYRFMENADGLKKTSYFPIVKRRGYYRFYNTVLCPEDNLQTFTFIISTWSGIYRRDFLLENQIWHNESEGALYQDSGFWFQTFLYARRAMFINKAYYFYRTDNPNSSVRQKGKAYAIFGEYDFVKDVLERDRGKQEKFRYVYSNAKFRSCFFQLKRIGEQYKLGFCRKMGQEFAKARRDGTMDKSLFKWDDWAALKAMERDPEGYYRDTVQKRDELIEQLRAFECVLLYGAGNVGGQMLSFLTQREESLPVTGFVVTNRENIRSDIRGIPVYEVDEVEALKEKAAVLIATTEIYQQEIGNLLKERGFKHIFNAPVFRVESAGITDAEEANGHSLPVDKKRILTPFGFRSFVGERFGEGWLPKLYGTWERFGNIKFEELPDAFVFGFSHYMGEEQFVSDKRNENDCNRKYLSDVLAPFLRMNMGAAFASEPRLLYAREFIGEHLEKRRLFRMVYRNGNIDFICVEWRDFEKEGFNVRRDFYDDKWNLMDLRIKYPPSGKSLEKPEGLEDTLRVARKVAEGFSRLTVDFMFYNGKWFAMGASLWLDDIWESCGKGMEP